MMTTQQFFSAFMPKAKVGFARPQELRARVRETGTGVRIKFSDGRQSWLAREGRTSDVAFREAVEQWIRRHGVGSNEIAWE